MIVAIVLVYTRYMFSTRNRDALYSFLPFLPYLVWKWKKELRYFTGIAPSCFHLSTVELFSPSNPKWFLEPVSRFEKNHSYIRYFSWCFWSFDLYYL